MLNGVLVGVGNFGSSSLMRLTGRGIERDKGHHIEDLSEMVEFLFLAEQDKSLLRKKGKEFGIGEHRQFQEYQKIDTTRVGFAIIATPASEHYGPAQYFIEKGIPTLVACPIDNDLRRAENLADLAERKGVPNVSGSELLNHPALTQAKQYIENCEIEIRDISINWLKNRGDRDHPIEGILQEEGIHPYSILSSLTGNTYPRIVTGRDRRGNIIIHPDKLQRFEKKSKICLEGYHRKQNLDYFLANIPTWSKADILFDDGTTSEISMSFEVPRKERTVQINGRYKDKDLFERYVTLYIDLTSLPIVDTEKNIFEDSLVVFSGVTSQRSGVGNIQNPLKGIDLKYDAQGLQLQKFLKYSESGRSQIGLSSFRDNLNALKIMDLVDRSARRMLTIRYNKRAGYFFRE